MQSVNGKPGSPKIAATALNIVIVDDDPAVLDGLRTIFERENCTVRTFASGDRFLTAAPQQLPDCLLLDVQMPGRSGLQVLESLSGRAYLFPIIMMSGVGNIPLAVAAIRERPTALSKSRSTPRLSRKYATP